MTGEDDITRFDSRRYRKLEGKEEGTLEEKSGKGCGEYWEGWKGVAQGDIVTV